MVEAVRILTSGPAIAGSTRAYWLSRYGINPTIVDIAPALRTGGYLIDFWGAGFDALPKAWLWCGVPASGLHAGRGLGRESEGRKNCSNSSHRPSPARLIGRYLSLPRSGLAASIFRQLEGKVKTIFGDSIESLCETIPAFRVSFTRAEPREFDLVVRAGGLHSPVRLTSRRSAFDEYQHIGELRGERCNCDSEARARTPVFGARLFSRVAAVCRGNGRWRRR
jgi:2-polyprenyl-6-methoxyphenol hydroxylase-like FAD-dependent oxidoreductase